MNSLQKAFIAKFNEHAQYLSRNYSRQIDPDEVMQNTYIALGRKNYEVDKVENYIKAAIFKVILNEIRRNKRYSNYAEIEDNFWVTERTPEDEVRSSQIRTKLVERISGNRKLDRILHLRFIEGLDNEEISSRLGMTLEQIRAHVKVNKFNGKLDYLKDLI